MGHEGHDHSHSHSAGEHKAHAPVHVATFIITCSDSRGPAEDETGNLIRSRLEDAGHTVEGHRVVRDDAAEIRSVLDEAVASGARAVVVNGGTGISARDVTIEAIRPLLEKELPGFGELFRSLSFREIGSPALLSRAIAGTLRGAIVFALPGSPQAARLALDTLILPELGHAVRELSRHR